MAQQTAVQYLLTLISKGEKLEITHTKCGHIIYAEDSIIENVLAMEKDQIIMAAADHCYPTCESARLEAEQYFNQTYGNDTRQPI
jgi:hypothetical protein